MFFLDEMMEAYLLIWLDYNIKYNEEKKQRNLY